MLFKSALFALLAAAAAAAVMAHDPVRDAAPARGDSPVRETRADGAALLDILRNPARRSPAESNRGLGRMISKHRSCVQLGSNEKLAAGDCTPSTKNQVKITTSNRVDGRIVVFIQFVDSGRYICAKNGTAFTMKSNSTECLFFEEPNESDWNTYYSFAYFLQNKQANSNRLYLVATKAGKVRVRVIPSEKVKKRNNVAFLLLTKGTQNPTPVVPWNRLTTKSTPGGGPSGGKKATTVMPRQQAPKTRPPCPTDKQRPGKVDIAGFLHPCRVEPSKPTQAPLPTQPKRANKKEREAAKEQGKIRHNRKHERDREKEANGKGVQR